MVHDLRPRPIDGEIALAHDYLTQRGGAERVVLRSSVPFPDAPLYTSFYDAAGTFPSSGRRHPHAPDRPDRRAPAPAPSCPAAPRAGVLPAAHPRASSRLQLERVGARSQDGGTEARLLPRPGAVALPARPLPRRRRAANSRRAPAAQRSTRALGPQGGEERRPLPRQLELDRRRDPAHLRHRGRSLHPPVLVDPTAPQSPCRSSSRAISCASRGCFPTRTSAL